MSDQIATPPVETPATPTPTPPAPQIGDRLGVLEKGLADMRGLLEEASKPRYGNLHPGLFAGQPPAYSRQVGEKGYSVLKACSLHAPKGKADPKAAVEESQISEKLRGLFPRSILDSDVSTLIVMDSKGLPADTPDALRTEIQQKMAHGVSGYDPDEAAWMLQRIHGKALGTVSDIAGGSLVGFPTLGELIDLQRNLEVFPRAGATDISFPANGRISFPKLTGGATANWVDEASESGESQPSTGVLNLEAKKLIVRVPINNELMRFANPTAEGVVRLDMARVAALKADLGMLEGTGGTQIKGLITYADILTHTASTTDGDGDTFAARDAYLMESKLPDAVIEPTAWVMRKNMHGAIMQRQADAVTAADGAGPFLFHQMSRPDGKPIMELIGTKVVRSSQVSNTRTKGAGVDLTYILLGFFPDWMIARMPVAELMADPYTRFNNDQTQLRLVQHLDAGARHGASFIICDQLVIG